MYLLCVTRDGIAIGFLVVSCCCRDGEELSSSGDLYEPLVLVEDDGQ